MSLLYPWATKEYLLWDMSLSQIMLYHNLGLEIKYPNPKTDKKTSYFDMSDDKLYKEREKLREIYGEV